MVVGTNTIKIKLKKNFAAIFSLQSYDVAGELNINILKLSKKTRFRQTFNET